MLHAPLRNAAVLLRATTTRQRIALQCDPRRQRILTIACAAVAAFLYLLATLNLQHARDALGAHSVVFVATHELRPGDTITAASLRNAHLPTVALAPTTLTESPLGKTVRQHVMPGEVLTSTNVHASNDTHVPRGWRVVAISVRAALPPLEAGARVDVIARAEILVTGAVVVSVGEGGRSAMIAVPAESAAVVATEAALGEATLAAG